MLDLLMPSTPMLCTLLLSARDRWTDHRPEFRPLFVSPGYPPLREEVPAASFFGERPQIGRREWQGESADSDRSGADDCARDSAMVSSNGRFRWAGRTCCRTPGPHSL